MHALSPPDSMHAMDLEAMRRSGITFWSAWEGTQLLGCGALKELDLKHAEIKSMRTPVTLRRQGAGRGARHPGSHRRCRQDVAPMNG